MYERIRRRNVWDGCSRQVHGISSTQMDVCILVTPKPQESHDGRLIRLSASASLLAVKHLEQQRRDQMTYTL